MSALLALLLGLPARADEATGGADLPDRVPLARTWDAWGWMRARGNGMTDPPLDETGARAERPGWLDSRFVYGVGFYPRPRLAVEIEVEEANAVLVGFTDVGKVADPHPFRVPLGDRKDVILTLPRKAFVEARDLAGGVARIGVQTFDWGLGALANDGMRDPDFGDPRQGDVSARIFLATPPFSSAATPERPGLTMFAAGDLVLRDDLAWIYRGDLAFAGMAGLRYDSPRLDLGALAGVRWQRDRETRVRPDGERPVSTWYPLDLTGRLTLNAPTAPQRLTLEAEGVFVTGHTTRPRLYQLDGLRILSGGVVGRLRFDDDAHHLTIKAEGGWASGDDDLTDDVDRRFVMHSDHQVGLVLFEQLLPLITARAGDRFTPPPASVPGDWAMINQGQVAYAAYLYPTVRWRPLPALDLRAGWLRAWTTGDVNDWLLVGTGGARHLGDEALLGARFRWEGNANLAVEIGAEGAVFVPGPVMDFTGMAVQGIGRGRVDFFW